MPFSCSHIFILCLCIVLSSSNSLCIFVSLISSSLSKSHTLAVPLNAYSGLNTQPFPISPHSFVSDYLSHIVKLPFVPSSRLEPCYSSCKKPSSFHPHIFSFYLHIFCSCINQSHRTVLHPTYLFLALLFLITQVTSLQFSSHSLLQCPSFIKYCSHRTTLFPSLRFITQITFSLSFQYFCFTITPPYRILSCCSLSVLTPFPIRRN